jgi:hypothetical protein
VQARGGTGVAVGAGVGVGLGDALGFGVGLGLGITDEVGVPVATLLGDDVGVPLATGLGDDVGRVVGLGVGTDDGETVAEGLGLTIMIGGPEAPPLHPKTPNAIIAAIAPANGRLFATDSTPMQRQIIFVLNSTIVFAWSSALTPGPLSP